MHLTSYGILVILITSTGEFFLYFTISFSFVSFLKKKKKLLQGCFCVALFLLQESIPSGLEIYEAGWSNSISHKTWTEFEL